MFVTKKFLAPVFTRLDLRWSCLAWAWSSCGSRSGIGSGRCWSPSGFSSWCCLAVILWRRGERSESSKLEVRSPEEKRSRFEVLKFEVQEKEFDGRGSRFEKNSSRFNVD